MQASSGNIGLIPNFFVRTMRISSSSDDSSSDSINSFLMLPEVTPGLKEAIEQKLGKLERYFTPETEIIVTLSVEKGRQKIEVTIPVKGSIIRSEQTSSDMYVSIDLVEEVIERQLQCFFR